MKKLFTPLLILLAVESAFGQKKLPIVVQASLSIDSADYKRLRAQLFATIKKKQ